MEISLYSSEECKKIAETASLRYVSDRLPGIRRKTSGKNFIYFDPNGNKINSEKELKRIRALAIPPAYQDVWICPYANGHIQATGRDSKHRKQYRYHPLWQNLRQQQKFDLMLEFGKAIKKIRNHVSAILNEPFSLTKKQIICSILYLLDISCIRIGNLSYAQDNKTYGITTLRKKHLSLTNKEAVLNFEGKNSKAWHINLNDKKIIKILKKCGEIPGYELFKYQDENETITSITSQDINFYLKNLTKHPFTAKDFRTWIASREFFCRLIKSSSTESASEIFSQSLNEVAKLLGHTPKICQKSYIHPEIIAWWHEGKLEKWKIKNQSKLKSYTDDNLLVCWLKALKKN